MTRLAQIDHMRAVAGQTMLDIEKRNAAAKRFRNAEKGIVSTLEWTPSGLETGEESDREVSAESRVVGIKACSSGIGTTPVSQFLLCTNARPEE